VSTIRAVHEVVDRVGLVQCKEHREEACDADDRAAEAERSERKRREGTEAGSAAPSGDQRRTIEERGRSLRFPERPAYG